MSYPSDDEYDAMTPEEKEAFDQDQYESQQGEIAAENAWLIASENAFDPDAEEELRREAMDPGLMYLREGRERDEE